MTLNNIKGIHIPLQCVLRSTSNKLFSLCARVSSVALKQLHALTCSTDPYLRSDF